MSERAGGPLTVVVPMYNEAGTLSTVLEKVLAQPLVGEVVLVDDGSGDETRAIAKTWEEKEERVRFLVHDHNQGKGAALRTGFQAATRDFVIVQDADLEYDPGDFERVVGPLVEDKADVVYGSRYLRSDPRRVLKFWHTMGNRFLTLLSNMASDLYVTDMETCYKAFRREVIQAIEIEENRFGFEPEVTAKLARMEVRVMETSVAYYPRSYDEGKKIGVKDGFRAIWCVWRYNVTDKTTIQWKRDHD